MFQKWDEIVERKRSCRNQTTFPLPQRGTTAQKKKQQKNTDLTLDFVRSDIRSYFIFNLVFNKVV